MSEDERNDLLELKAFIKKAIPLVDQQLIDYPSDGATSDFRFLVEKAIMYRETLKQINDQLQTDK